ncbi:MAG: hypothetical protein JNK02_17590 [Planctomycetes bacterium]|nr:hypothetical protein [Planctomycetota bacterium]
MSPMPARQSTTPTVRLARWGALGLVVLAATWLWRTLLTERAVGDGAVHPEAAVAPSIGGEGPASMESPRAPLLHATEPDRTGEEILAEFWGADWARIREELVESGIDLDGRYRILPWAEASSRIEAEFVRSLEPHLAGVQDSLRQWPDTGSSPAWLKEYFRLDRTPTPQEVAHIEALTLDFNLQLGDLVEVYRRDLDAAVRRALSAQTYRRFPIATVASRNPAGADVFAGAAAYGGWAAALALYGSDHPGLLAQQQQIKSVRVARNAQVRAYLQGR